MNVHRTPGAAMLAAAVALFALAASAPARADTVTDWNAIASTAIVTTAGQPPHASTLSFAMVQGAVYDAVNAIDGGHSPYLVARWAASSDSTDAAAATAAFRVLAALFPSQLPTLQPRYDASLATIADGPGKDGGVAAGESAAAATRSRLIQRLLTKKSRASRPKPLATCTTRTRRSSNNFARDSISFCRKA